MKLLYLILSFIVLNSCTRPTPVIFIDEKVSTIEKYKSLDTNQVYSVMPWPAGIVPKKWKQHNDKGVIIVHTKTYNSRLEQERHALLVGKVREAINGNYDDMLFYFNGVKVTYDKLGKLIEIRPDNLYSVEILNKEIGEKFYESEARNVNIVINTKNLLETL